MKRKCRSEHLQQGIHRTSRHMYTSLQSLLGDEKLEEGRITRCQRGISCVGKPYQRPNQRRCSKRLSEPKCRTRLCSPRRNIRREQHFDTTVYVAKPIHQLFHLRKSSRSRLLIPRNARFIKLCSGRTPQPFAILSCLRLLPTLQSVRRP